MVTIERKKLEQVLDDLICASSYCNTYDAIDVVKEALAQPEKGLFIDLIAQHEGLAEELAQPEQEPVAFIESKADNECADAYADGWNACVHAHKDTTPPKRPWVGLTNERMWELWNSQGDDAMERLMQKDLPALAAAIEAKLKELNT